MHIFKKFLYKSYFRLLDKELIGARGNSALSVDVTDRGTSAEGESTPEKQFDYMCENTNQQYNTGFDFREMIDECVECNMLCTYTEVGTGFTGNFINPGGLKDDSYSDDTKERQSNMNTNVFLERIVDDNERVRDDDVSVVKDRIDKSKCSTLTTSETNEEWTKEKASLVSKIIELESRLAEFTVVPCDEQLSICEVQPEHENWSVDPGMVYVATEEETDDCSTGELA